MWIKGFNSIGYDESASSATGRYGTAMKRTRENAQQLETSHMIGGFGERLLMSLSIRRRGLPLHRVRVQYYVEYVLMVINVRVHSSTLPTRVL